MLWSIRIWLAGGEGEGGMGRGLLLVGRLNGGVGRNRRRRKRRRRMTKERLGKISKENIGDNHNKRGQ